MRNSNDVWDKNDPIYSKDYWIEKGFSREELTRGIFAEGDEMGGMKMQWWPGRGIFSRGFYKDGKREGIQRWWHENGKQAAEYNYVDGKPEGEQKQWFENGRMVRHWRIKDGQDFGFYQWWYENGNREAEYNYVDGKQEGEQKEWYRNGQLKQHWVVKDGQKHRFYREWDENGNPLLTEPAGYYRKGVLKF